MDDIDMLIEDIKKVLKSELPSRYEHYYSEFVKLTDKNLLRASYGLLDELRRKQDWHPSIRLLGLIDRYKIVF